MIELAKTNEKPRVSRTRVTRNLFPQSPYFLQKEKQNTRKKKKKLVFRLYFSCVFWLLAGYYSEKQD